MTEQAPEADAARRPRGERMSALVALLVEVFRLTGSWRAVRVLVDDGARRHGLDEIEVALRLLRELAWPMVNGDDDALEVVATACCGDDDLWWAVIDPDAGASSGR